MPGGDPPGRRLLRAVRILLECILVVIVVRRFAFMNLAILLYGLMNKVFVELFVLLTFLKNL